MSSMLKNINTLSKKAHNFFLWIIHETSFFSLKKLIWSRKRKQTKNTIRFGKFNK